MAKSLVLALIALIVVSCENAETSAEMKRYNEKKAEVEALDSELQELKAKIKEIKVAPPEVPIEQLEKELEEKSAAVAKLKSDFSELSKNEKEAREELESYRKKYPLDGE